MNPALVAFCLGEVTEFAVGSGLGLRFLADTRSDVMPGSARIVQHIEPVIVPPKTFRPRHHNFPL